MIYFPFCLSRTNCCKYINRNSSKLWTKWQIERFSLYFDCSYVDLKSHVFIWFRLYLVFGRVTPPTIWMKIHKTTNNAVDKMQRIENIWSHHPTCHSIVSPAELTYQLIEPAFQAMSSSTLFDVVFCTFIRGFLSYDFRIIHIYFWSSPLGTTHSVSGCQSRFIHL